ncbi:expressed unknown protein [Seminavis robusta]|uniref:Uncharacterized protein n=1 Tax=Seminavis robusta TaxID=568900 RepID=A0A9N8E4H9_9STRA|nr:expressed unknown protein [Seminavis robusta]|eukprot:Sro657_g182620.1 n/a (166) ;mRNA; r:53064-53561
MDEEEPSRTKRKHQKGRGSSLRKRSRQTTGTDESSDDKANCSEILYPCHIFDQQVQDQIRSLKRGVEGEEDEQRLVEWSSAVQEKLHQQDDLIVKNIRLVRDFRSLHEKCHALQKEKLKQMRKIQQLKDETSHCNLQIQGIQSKGSKQERAKRFLLSLKSSKSKI